MDRKKGALKQRALIFDIKRDCSEDGPGIRTTVFFKGCHLSCVWCQNPEGQSRSPDLSFRAEACRPSECERPCLDACPEACLRMGRELEVDRSSCTRCNRCFEVCPTRALKPVGYWITLDELLYRVSIDKPFYLSTNGGVTLSGGEALLQEDFVHGFLRALKREGIQTALETSGLFHLESFRRRILPYLDRIYFDLKLIDEKESYLYTGHSNRTVLENFAGLVRNGEVPVIPRIPLVPKITATRENLSGLSGLLRSHGVGSCSLMPYNPLWLDKVGPLGLTPRYHNSAFMTEAEKRACVQFFCSSPTPGFSARGSPAPPVRHYVRELRVESSGTLCHSQNKGTGLKLRGGQGNRENK